MFYSRLGSCLVHTKHQWVTFIMLSIVRWFILPDSDTLDDDQAASRIILINKMQTTECLLIFGIKILLIVLHDLNKYVVNMY